VEALYTAPAHRLRPAHKPDHTVAVVHSLAVHISCFGGGVPHLPFRLQLLFLQQRSLPFFFSLLFWL
jgi:hypothetical protein